MESPFLSLLASLQGTIPGIQLLRWDLAPAALAPGERVWVLLEDSDSTPLVLDVEVRAQAIPCERGTQETRKWAGVPICRPWKAHIIYLRVVLRMTDRQLVPVYCRFHPMHSTMVCRNQPHGELKSALQTRIYCQSLTKYEYPIPVHFKALASADIPDLSAPG